MGDQDARGEDQAYVLVIDDNFDNADTLCTLIEGSGPRARACYTVESAVVAVRAGLPTLVLCDVLMPDGGVNELMRRLHQENLAQTVPLFGTTGHPRPEIVPKGNYKGIVKKPFNLETLETLFREHCGVRL